MTLTYRFGLEDTAFYVAAVLVTGLAIVVVARILPWIQARRERRRQDTDRPRTEDGPADDGRT